VVLDLLEAAVDEGDGAAAGVTSNVSTADEIIARLGLQPHPEGGHFREMFRASDPGRGASTAIFFLLKAGERSHWHRVDADEVWHHYSGAALELSMSDDGHAVRRLRLGSDFGIGETPQTVVPRGVWQAARSLGSWTLVGCTVAPAFDFAGFELAPPGWQPRPS
jgi:predicted cupin superfamily sugar epimerase